MIARRKLLCNFFFSSNRSNHSVTPINMMTKKHGIFEQLIFTLL
jgi:hypothetical protein